MTIRNYQWFRSCSFILTLTPHWQSLMKSIVFCVLPHFAALRFAVILTIDYGIKVSAIYNKGLRLMCTHAFLFYLSLQLVFFFLLLLAAKIFALFFVTRIFHRIHDHFWYNWIMRAEYALFTNKLKEKKKTQSYAELRLMLSRSIVSSFYVGLLRKCEKTTVLLVCCNAEIHE